MSLHKASDTVLVSQLRAGVPEALTELFRRFWKPLYLQAYYKLQSHETAEEIVQDLFTELWDKREHLLRRQADDPQLSAYLQRAVRNRILNHIRRKVYDQKYWQYCKEFLPASTNGTAEMAEYNDLQEKLQGAIERLSEKTREIFVLHKLKGIPVVQISRQLNLSEKAIGYHLTKSVREIRTHLRDFI